MEAAKPGFKEVEKWSENALWSVSELHVGDEKQTGSNKSDMVIIILPLATYHLL
jgi:protein downstream neighbor of Son